MPTPPPTLQHTPLHPLHLEQNAKMVPFAGYQMPLNYPLGILKEATHTRAKNSAGLFDVSHMGQITIHADQSTDKSTANPTQTIARALETLIPSDLLALPPNHQKYALLTNQNGGIIDDLIVQNLTDHFMLIVNAANKTQDLKYLQSHLQNPQSPHPPLQIHLQPDLALLALQGPAAAAILQPLIQSPLTDLKFMQTRPLQLTLNRQPIPCTLSRSGYTGEDGFEISLPAAHAETLARHLLTDHRVKMTGLGARDSLRLEAGLCLHGQDLTPQTTPTQANLNWAISKARRANGTRPANFPGASKILPQIADPATTPRTRVGLIPQTPAPIRPPTPLFATLADATASPTTNPTPIGEITSGGFSPTLRHPISIASLNRTHAAPETEIFALIRQKPVSLLVSKLPFVPHRYAS